MILPLPTADGADETAVRFIALDQYEDFFEDLRRGFPYRHTPGIGCSAGPTSGTIDDAAYLEVKNVGDYVASFVPTVDDFDRLDPRFSIPKETWEQVPDYHNYGFAVFQLKSLQAEAHPMGIEFPTRKPDEVFFPTVHIHDGTVPDSEEFDHQLYLQHAGFDSVVGNYRNTEVKDKATGFVRSDVRARDFVNIEQASDILNAELLVHKSRLFGALPNRDQWFAISGDPNVPSINYQYWLRYWPLAAIVALSGWFLARRSRLRNDDASPAASGSDS